MRVLNKSLSMKLNLCNLHLGYLHLGYLHLCSLTMWRKITSSPGWPFRRAVSLKYSSWGKITLYRLPGKKKTCRITSSMQMAVILSA